MVIVIAHDALDRNAVNAPRVWLTNQGIRPMLAGIPVLIVLVIGWKENVRD